MQAASTYSRDRCVTGIHGLDEILRGGIPYGSTVLASGTCGSGKTTLAMEFLVRGALAGEACAHFTATEPSVTLPKSSRNVKKSIPGPLSTCEFISSIKSTKGNI